MGRSRDSLELKKRRYFHILDLEDGDNQLTQEIIYKRLGVHETTQRKWKKEWLDNKMPEWEE